jgi:hypothetical protein
VLARGFLQEFPYACDGLDWHLSVVCAQSRDGKDDSSPSDAADLRVRESFSAHKAHEDAENGEACMALCALAAVEQDPKKLLILVSEINRLLSARNQRLANEASKRVNPKADRKSRP